MKTLTVSACRRPLYTSLVLSALARCDGIREYRVRINIDQTAGSPNYVAVLAAIRPFLTRSLRWELVNTDGIGCNAAIAACVDWGMEQSDFHVHLEDDTLPSRDFLCFMEWVKCGWRGKAEAFSATGYAKKGGEWAGAEGRKNFSPWGWGIWRDRWDEARPQLDLSSGLTWDCQMARIRGDRLEIAPTLGRTQNIGQHGGSFNNPDLWAAEQFNPVWKESVCPQFFTDQFVYLGVEKTE